MTLVTSQSQVNAARPFWGGCQKNTLAKMQINNISHSISNLSLPQKQQIQNWPKSHYVRFWHSISDLVACHFHFPDHSNELSNPSIDPLLIAIMAEKLNYLEIIY